ncbi:MAG: hypothetical protein UX80_C0003G0008 [Candidatus Amesbacteria bacterium GW2011_GWA2_47_11b]|uniref:Uncharacterized protein n=2 Tax=Candidatus Amesiibacteriota TaxID=1752730 RepID=A0A0G1SF08_9BACT|nr:MAG: hypothetical protein UX42_C0022G0006 [Microgenomates group bacterium GW2011_GWC1_46_20]KKU58353.1 MAG: hypothetical protein UX80_C0003G0008 [Candidatus Amesbacteria bacterium GW2011_GWA2_47_11b]KKU68001.1 MAG: hypothetical protein UX92_C0025G0005 [Candidatus Amesbacteria bacterium GW2011_GWA1_47_20]
MNRVEDLFYLQGAAELDGEGAVVRLPSGAEVSVLVTYQEWPLGRLERPRFMEDEIKRRGLDRQFYYYLVVAPVRLDMTLAVGYIDGLTLGLFAALRDTGLFDEGLMRLAPEVLLSGLSEVLTKKLEKLETVRGKIGV